MVHYKTNTTWFAVRPMRSKPRLSGDPVRWCVSTQASAKQHDPAPMDLTNTFSPSELQRVREIAESERDEPVLMLNLNFCSAEANFPNGSLYHRYLAALAKLLP